MHASVVVVVHGEPRGAERRVKRNGLYSQPPMSFPASSLRPRHAEISALVFENLSVGIPLGLYWSFRVEFEAIKYSKYEFNCNLSADWAKIPRRDWRELAGWVVEGGNDVIDASFYTTGHDSATYTTICIGERQGARFAFDWQSRIDFLGWTGDDADPDLLVHARTTAAFTGVLVYTPLLRRFPSPREGAEGLLCQFIDRNAFGQLVNRSNEFGVDEWRLLPE